jgi:hypothetical protein
MNINKKTVLGVLRWAHECTSIVSEEVDEEVLAFIADFDGKKVRLTIEEVE